MIRTRLIRLILLAALLLFVGWISKHTYWGEVKVPMPPKGEAAVNPFYAAEHLVSALGARATWDRSLGALPREAVLVVSGWHWSLSTARRERLERWVESGGRLVVDRTLVGDEGEFEHWSGIERIERTNEGARGADSTRNAPPPQARGPMATGCRTLRAEDAATSSMDTAASYEVCGLDSTTRLSSPRPIDWALRERNAIEVLRVRVGRGSVSAINAVAPFTFRALFDGDHARLLVAVTRLHRGDEVHFLSEDAHGSLVSLLWQVAAPVVVLLLAALALLLWQRGARFGPLSAQPDRARRSLAEQIVGTGEFLLQVDGSAPLHAAALRALTEAARHRVPGYARLSVAEQVATLVGLTGLPARALSAAIEYRGARRRNELYSDIALIEAARRRILPNARGSLHGNRVDHDYARG